MKYDNEYYLLHEVKPASSYMLAQVKGTDEGLFRLMSLRSIKRSVSGQGKVGIQQGDASAFSPSDYHEIAEHLVSEKLKAVLESFNLPRVDFYQTDISNGDKVWSEHYLMHIWNNHKAIHPGRSVIDGSYIDDDFFLDALSLNEKVLDQVPLEERLVFRLEEDPTFLFHESVVKALEGANLSGLGFIKVKDWGIGSEFDD